MLADLREPHGQEVAGRRAARHIARAAQSAVNLLDVKRVVLGGESSHGISSILRHEIDTEVNSVRVARIARALRGVSVEPSLIGATVGAVGAASLVLHGDYAPGWRMLTDDAA